MVRIVFDEMPTREKETWNIHMCIVASLTIYFKRVISITCHLIWAPNAAINLLTPILVKSQIVLYCIRNNYYSPIFFCLHFTINIIFNYCGFLNTCVPTHASYYVVSNLIITRRMITINNHVALHF
jgi:hypothetical protein